MNSYPFLNMLDGLEKNEYPQYRYLYFMLPVLLNAKAIVETGFAQGHSTRIWLESLSQLSNPESRILHTYEIDDEQYVKVADDILTSGLANASNKPHWILHYEDSTKAKFEGIEIDLLYLDSDHAYETVTGELKTFTPHLTGKAVILTHDSWPGGTPHESYSKITGGRPSDTFWALSDFADKNGWRKLLFTFPEGVTLLYRER